MGNTLIDAPLNFAARTRRGIDTQLAYRVNLGSQVTVNTNLIYTHNLEINNYQDQLNPTFANRILGELGDPVDEFRLGCGPFLSGVHLRLPDALYRPDVRRRLGEQQRHQRLPAGQRRRVLADQKYPAITYSDIRFEWNIRNTGGIADSLRFYFGVDNVFDRQSAAGHDRDRASEARSTTSAAATSTRGFRARF